MNLMKSIALVAIASACTLAIAADAGERKFIREGMGEGEVLFKIGKPDHEAFISNVRGEPEQKSWTYFPTSKIRRRLPSLRFTQGWYRELIERFPGRSRPRAA